jgi:hypothetical protein
MPAAQGIALQVEINRRADVSRIPDDARTHGERQVDALIDAFTDSGHRAARTRTMADSPTASAARKSWLRAEVQVVIGWREMLGLRDGIGELIGYGPIAAADVRAMVSEPGTVLRRLVVDDQTGMLVDYGRTRYRPDSHLVGLVKSRDATCRSPGCTRSARDSDLDHTEPYPRGATSSGNLTVLCTRHHGRKTFGGFGYTRPDPTAGETRWTTPLGFTYEQMPARYHVDGVDPGDCWELRQVEQDQRWVPPMPDPPDAGPPDVDPPDVDPPGRPPPF